MQALGDERRIDMAKLVLTDLIEETLPSGIPLALRVFDDEPDAGETDLAIDLEPLEGDSAVNRIASIESVDGVKTPIGAALEQVAVDLDGIDGPKIVVLVTRSEETCGGNPQRAIRELVEQELTSGSTSSDSLSVTKS